MNKKLSELIGDQVKENEILALHTTFKIGGPAKYFYVAHDSSQLLRAVKSAEKLNIPYVILGWGSNVLVSDDGFPGLVIKSTSDRYEISGQEISAEAGFSLNRLVGLAAQAGLSGLEQFVGIPSSVGGAARGNAGAFGVGLGDRILWVEVYQDGKIKKFSQTEMEYAYRESRLKHEPGIILSVMMKLEKTDPALIQQKVIEKIKSRKNIPLEPSAGCVFKNCELDKIQIDESRIVKELDVTLEEWREATKFKKLPIGYIVDRLGLKGKIIGGAKVSEKHGAFIVNIGTARAEHVLMLISDIKMEVRNKLGIQLQEEIEYIGF